MIETITYAFPKSPDGNAFFDGLTDILSELPNAVVEPHSTITLTALQPEKALPATVFAQEDILFPRVQLDANEDLRLQIGNFCINDDNSGIVGPSATPLTKAWKTDPQGLYYEVAHAGQTSFRLPISELHNRLKQHLVRIDHTGINIPASLIPKDTWSRFTSNLAQQSNMYRYPTGEDWPFILPAAEVEFTKDIASFPAGREPKCEFVYDTFSSVPAIQIDIETDLPRAEIERLFPDPYGVSFPELADYFRTVYVDHEWPGLNIRFDLRYKNTEPQGDWETGKWLVNEGGRLQ